MPRRPRQRPEKQMQESSPFHGDWIETLKIQYVHSIKTKDTNRTSLRKILEEAGFTEDQIQELEVLATMRET